MDRDLVDTAPACKRQRPIRAAASMLGGILMFGSATGVGHAVNGVTVWSWGTRTDTTGIDIGSMSNRTCFLSGVAGNLNLGAQQGFGCALGGKESTAHVSDKFPTTGHYWLVAHGGACENQADQVVWHDNPVNGQATCVFEPPTNVTDNWWRPGPPVRITGLNAPNGKVRRCFLSGVWGISGSWNSSTRFARVRRVTTPDDDHPTTGWYVDGNLPTGGDGSRPKVEARCLDFPEGTTVTVGTTPLSSTTETHAITSGTGVRACALMGIKGAFNVNSWTNGVVMNTPAQPTGNWSLTVSGGKTATWACVE
jgi:hypothetical protein